MIPSDIVSVNIEVTRKGSSGTPTPAPSIIDELAANSVALYLFDNINDSSGNNYTGGLNFNATLSGGELITGHDSRDAFLFPAAVTNGLGSFTMFSKAKITEVHANENHFWRCGDGTAQGEFDVLYTTTDNTWRVSIRGVTTVIVANSDIEDLLFHDLAVTYNSITGFIELYFDGVSIGSNTGTTGALANSSNAICSSTSPPVAGWDNYCWHGNVDIFGIWDKVLNSTEIQKLGAYFE